MKPSRILFPALDGPARGLIEYLSGLVERIFPVPPQFRSGAARDVAELSRLLTSARGERRKAYLNHPALLSAYLRYFLPWNVYRLVRLLSALPLSLKDGDRIIDLGSGPLTLPLALWIARADLRNTRLFFRCVDLSGAALTAGEKLFAGLTGDAGRAGGAIPGSGPASPANAASPAKAAPPETAWTIQKERGDFHAVRPS
ncbi:MAG: hypothetical protein LBC88_04985, partial [Spirochaetaceae bacterium]|nr:hypothetical protein [Spirochaetaceae bacterium]